MNCTDIDQHIDGFLDGELSSLRKQAFERHVSRCDECGAKVVAESQLRAMLHDMPVPEPSADFRNRVFARVRHEYSTVPQNHFQMKMVAGFASVAAFSLTLWFVSGMHVTVPVNMSEHVVSVASNESQSVRIMFEADNDIKQAELNVDLPDNVQLVGYPDRKTLSWKTDLQKGQNILALPVQAISKGRGELHTRLSYHDKVKTYNFVIDAEGSRPTNATQNF